MLTQGYEADGWLGLMLGTSMWYALYGGTLSSENAFEDRMDALCRELGVRGRADAVVVATESVPAATASDDADLPDGDDALRNELRSLRVRDLMRKARGAQLSEDALLDAQDSDDVKASLIDILLAAQLEQSANVQLDCARKLELEELGVRELLARARALKLDAEVEAAQDSDDPKGAVVQLLIGAERRT